MPKKKQSNKVLIIGILIIVFIAVFSAVMVFLLFVNNSLQKMQTDVYNVKEAVAVQQKNSLQSMQDKLEAVIAQTDKQTQVLTYQYISKTWGVKFDIKVDSLTNFQIIENENILMFGSVAESSTLELPPYTVRRLINTNLADYKKQIRFKNEICEPDINCLFFDFEFSKLDNDRNLALDKIFESGKFSDLEYQRFLLNEDCIVPMVLIYNKENNEIFEFQGSCLTDQMSAGYDELMEIIKTFSFVN